MPLCDLGSLCVYVPPLSTRHRVFWVRHFFPFSKKGWEGTPLKFKFFKISCRALHFFCCYARVQSLPHTSPYDELELLLTRIVLPFLVKIFSCFISLFPRGVDAFPFYLCICTPSLSPAHLYICMYVSPPHTTTFFTGRGVLGVRRATQIVLK